MYVLIPSKQFSNCKRRLSAFFSKQDRIALSQAMLIDMLNVLAASACVKKILILSSDKQVESLIAKHADKALWLRETSQHTLNHSIHHGKSYCESRDYFPLLIIPSDLPLLTAQDISRLSVYASNANAQTLLVPDRHFRGTNAILLTAPIDLRFNYGNNSFHLHKEQLSKHQGSTLEVFDTKGFTHDLDTINDIDVITHQLPEGHTRSFFERTALKSSASYVGPINNQPLTHS